MLIYFAHPIDQAPYLRRGQLQSAPFDAATDEIANALQGVGLSVYRPADAFTIADAPLSDLEAIDRINVNALMTADALIAWLPRGVATLGVPAEIEQAMSWGKPVVVLTDPWLATRSVQVAGWRARGAEIRVWNHHLRKTWQNDCAELIDLLRSKRETPIELPMIPSTPPFEVQLDPAAIWPTNAYEDDAGLDLAIIEETQLAPGEYKLIRTGVRGAVPSGWWGFMIGRSSTWIKHRLEVKLAVIDAGYRGELMIGVQSHRADTIVLEAGMRLAQYVLIPTFPGEVAVVDRLPEAHRGDNGYGSSGH